LPLAGVSLRTMRKDAPSAETVSISAADPLNLAGILLPGERVAANSGKHVTFRDGVFAGTEEDAPGLSQAIAV
jgi:ATP-dependent helicase Lhr and Lhr-like helicase